MILKSISWALGMGGLLLASLFLNHEKTGKGMPGIDDRQTARKLHEQGNYLESLELFLKLFRSENLTDRELAEDWPVVVTNLQHLQQLPKFDELLKEFREKHANKPRFQKQLAISLMNIEHFGFLVAGEFYRGGSRGGGEWTSAQERDRMLVLQILRQAEPAMIAVDDRELLADYYWQLGQAVIHARLLEQPWRLQEKTDLEILPDLEPADRWGWRGGMGWGGEQRGAPVDEQGNPIVYRIAESWDAAANDGERWRWAMDKSAKLADSYRDQVEWAWASFLHGQFGVQTMAQWGGFFRSLGEERDGKPQQDNPFAVSKLKDEETIARLATGVKRFQLEDEFNPIKIFQKLSQGKGAYRSQALVILGQIFEDRQQYPRAAEIWQQLAKEHKNQGYEARHDQIVKPWGRFESQPVQVAGKPTSLEFRFRNGQHVSLVARSINMEQLIKDTQAYLKSNPKEFDWQRIQFEGVASTILQNNMRKYVGAEVASWKVDLQPRADHFDRRVTLTTPVQNAGAYLISAQIKGGNECHIVQFVEDTVLLRKPVNGKWLYFVGDARSGRPLPKTNVEFFGWAHRWDEQGKHSWIATGNFAEISDADGFVEADPKLMSQDMNWMVIARGSQGRLATLGFNGAWVNGYSDSTLQGLKIYGITDRPVYRPAQSMKFKFWIREATYSRLESQPYANQPVLVRVLDPQGVEVARFDKQTDANAGVDGEFVLAKDATLGQYSLAVSDSPNASRYSGQVSFRVEEYKKPEFEVVVTPPEKPVRLGEKVPVKIEAKYYFGGPVQEGIVSYKVHRTKKDQRWYPIRPWDWLYGNGYWWFSGDYEWYPGFNRWGCRCPVQPWWGYSADPPELVVDAESRLGADGTVQFELDTSLAKAIHGDSDHEYSITAEVVDASRRTIVGSGSVVVARRPFAVHVWTDCGFAHVGQAISVSMKARTVDGKGVRGTGKLQLLKIRYDEAGAPTESVLQEWSVATNDEGDAAQQIKATEAGQFRLAYQLTNAEGDTIEGGILFNAMGSGFDSANFRYNDLEVVTEKAEYAPGEKVKLLITSNQTDARVMLWIRPLGTYAARPVIMDLDGKSGVYELEVTQADMPNFFVEATTIFDAKIHQVVKEVFVPPVKKVVNVSIEPQDSTVVPGKETKVKVTLTDGEGRPFTGDLVMTMYDRAVEYISGGSNVPAIREFFWQWKRGHSPHTEHSLGRQGGNLVKDGQLWMNDLGVFGSLTADVEYFGAQVAEGGDLSGFGGGGGGRIPGGVRLGRPMAPAARGMALDAMEAKGAVATEAAPMGGAGGGVENVELAPVTVRTEFADAAFWSVGLKPNSDGIAEATIKMPENLTAWKIRTWAMGPQTDVGEGTAEIKTAKNIMVRLQAPRFFVEKDEVVLSAVVHNYLKETKSTKVSLAMGGGTLATSDPLEKQVSIPAGGETRVDWRVQVQRDGAARITMQAQTDVESDAMEMSFPVFVHGMLKTESFSGIVREGEPSTTFLIDVPQERRPDQTRLEIRYSPTLAGAMVDALPYLVDYPYGCTEQTLNRFVPTVVTFDILNRMNLDLAAIREKRTNLNAQEITDTPASIQRWQRMRANPVFDPSEVALMVKKGVKDLTAMQCSDGGWGWFAGTGERSWPHTTAVVVHGLQLAQKSKLGLVPGVLERGLAWLQQYQNEQVALLLEGDRLRELPPEKRPVHARYRDQADNLDALIYMILLDADVANPQMGDYLYRDRTKLSLYGLALAGLAFDKQQAIERRDMVMRNIDQFVKYDPENQTAFIDLPNQNYWWYWYGNSLEANAFYLKLLSRVNPRDPKAAGLVKYLLNNRRNGSYWNSTRDTACCIEALAEFMERSEEIKPNMTVEIVIDGEVRQSVEITPAVLFQFDNSFIIEGESLASGAHKVELRRQGGGNLYANVYLTNFTLEDDISAAGLEIKVERKFYKLEQIKNATNNVSGSRGQVVEQKVEKYRRVPLQSWDEVRSGDQIEVELEIDSKNDYEYVIFEDMKVAGCEPVELRSGYVPGSLSAYVEFRDERVAFFARQLTQGKHSFSYRVRAEIPGRFSALPTKAWAMYSPELKANSSEMKLEIKELE